MSSSHVPTTAATPAVSKTLIQSPPLELSTCTVDSGGTPLSPHQLKEQAYYNSIVIRRKPTLCLPREHRVTKLNKHPPHLMYGFALTRPQIFAYAQSRELQPVDPSLGPLAAYLCLFPSLQRLREVTGEPYLGFSPSFPPSDTYVVTLYTNYTVNILQCVDDNDEKEILDSLRQELGIDGTVQPMWFWYGGTEWDDY
ncbi:hypothetical protein BV25DRAFT_1913083 [Artomyces pyxidatus]|uniref:Uncharacterized protein n=1 Tax=Artomyces pyxidatus TaxID=48021 RepID=A0ACB8TDC3_9AGAM|nr:hypothetical protein BV25DRAFT_1913083 [Artomyces pyxidatus]